MKKIYLLIFVCLPFIVNSQVPTVTSESTVIVQEGNNIFRTTAGEIANLFTPSASSVDSSMLGTGVVTSRIIKNGTIVGKDINQMSATTGQVLAWSGSDWLPATVAGGSPGGSSNQVQTNDGSGGFAGDADFVRNIGATTGNEIAIATSTLTSGSGLAVAITGTGAASNSKTAGNFTSSGANSTSSQTVYGLKGDVSNTGTTSTNVGVYGKATGATNNYAGIFESGKLGVGLTAPIGDVHLNSTTAGNVEFQITNATTGATSGDGFNINHSGTDVTIENKESGKLIFATAGTTGPYISGGRIGLGLNNPVSYLSNTSSVLSDGFATSAQTTHNNALSLSAVAAGYLMTINNTTSNTNAPGILIKAPATGSVARSIVVLNNTTVAFGVIGLKLAVGTETPTNDFSFGGNSARTMWMERHTTANTAGNNLTIQAGGATSAATNKNGGDLLLQAGTPTGTGASNIRMSVAADGAGGTADNAVTEKFTILGNGKVGIGATTPLATLANSNTTLSSDDLTSPLSAHHLGIDWQAAGAGGYLTALNNSSTNTASSGLLIKTASAATSGRPLTILQGSTLVFGVLGSKIGMGTETPTNDLSFGGDADRTFGVDRRTTSTYLGKSLTINAGGATAGQTNKSGGDLILKSGISTGNESSKISFFTATNDASGTADRVPTEKLRIDGDGLFHQWNGNIQGEGDAEHVSVVLRKGITGTAQGEIFKNGVDSRFDIASGHVYNIRVTIVASIDNVGTLGTLSVGDSYTAEYQGMFKNVSGTTTLVGALVTTLTPILDTNMAGASVSVTADNTNDALSVKFTPPTLAVSDTVTNVVATIQATKLGF